jgi:RNA polymerase sigma-70 factor, ECF subfamily
VTPLLFDSPTSFSLIRRVRGYDPEAWRTLSKLYGPLVYRWARQCGLQSHDAADVVQNVFVSVYRGIGRFEHDRPESSFRGWLWTITRNAARELLRKQARHPAPAGGSDANQALQQLPDLFEQESEPTEFDAGQSLAQRALRLVRESLDENTWEAFRRTTILDEAAVTVATDLAMTAKAVRQAKYRVLLRLRQLLADS